MTEDARTTENDDEQVHPTRASNANAGGKHGLAGGMGVSSERVGHSGPGQVGADGVADTSPVEPPSNPPPEQRPGAPEENPVGIPPKASKTS